MKKLVLVAGALLLFSLLFPNGVTLPVVGPAVVAPVAPAADTDSKIVELLKEATPEDKARVVSIYNGMRVVLARDKGERISSTEKWADFQANTLQLAVEQVGRYPGLDDAIEAVFAKQVGTDDVVPTKADTLTKLLKACEIIAASAF
jgi:hypothetical protein